MRDANAKSAISVSEICESARKRTTATLVRTERASQVRVTGGICVNQASKPTTGMSYLLSGAGAAGDGVLERG